MDRLRVWAVTACVCLLLGTPAFAQVPYAGIQGGATSGDLEGGAVNTTARWGGTAGVFIGANPNRNSLVKLEGNWVQKGGADIKLSYIEIPLLLGGVAPTSNGAGRFALYAGIALAFKVSCTSASATLNCDQAKSTEWAVPLGATIGGYKNGRFVGVDVRYSIGLSDAFNTSIARNRSWQFRVVIGTEIRR